jgi:molecular chaperone GrpE (heat shock protein)
MNYPLIVFCLILSTGCVATSDSNKTNTPTVNSNEVSHSKNTSVALTKNESYKSDYTNVTILSGILLGIFVILYRQNKFISEIRELRDQQPLVAATTEFKPQPEPALTSNSSVEPVKNETLDELSKSLSQAMNEISKRDATISNLTANVTRSNIQNNLVRLTQTLDIACLIHARLANGKSNANESIEFIIEDIKSALNGQGVEFSEIKPGTRVADLPAGSFAAISVVDAPNDSLKGTVKEVRSLCYFVNEENKKPRYIAAAKVILYRA